MKLTAAVLCLILFCLVGFAQSPKKQKNTNFNAALLNANVESSPSQTPTQPTEDFSGTFCGLGFIIIAIYFTPALYAILNKHRNASAITVLNILLGWTLIGWAIALVWALTKK